jgi:asparagine synthase (glutamine-hydrolysing)
MSGIAGFVTWDGQPAKREAMDRMMSLMEHRGPDGLKCEICGSVALGHALVSLDKSDPGQSQPVWLPDRSAAIVADARLYNRAELIRRLEPVRWLTSEVSDSELILAAYQLWDNALFDYIDGDFAFAIWDANKRSVFAGRDPFGIKPLFYFSDHHHFIFASEPKQILAHGDVPFMPDDETIGDFLFNNFEPRRPTFFRGIWRLEPGYFLLAREGESIQTRYWSPNPGNEIHFRDDRDYLVNFRELLKKAVAKRLNTNCGIGAHLSGGFDSSAIVVLARELYQESSTTKPPLSTLTARFPGMACDESEYSQSVIDCVPFSSYCFYPLSEPLLDGLQNELFAIDSPWGADLQRGSFNACARIMRDIGARVLFTGLGGDELTLETFYLRDLARRKRYFLLIRDAFRIRDYSYKPPSWFIWDALRAGIPTDVRRTVRKFRPRASPAFPAWANSDFVDFYRTRAGSPSGDYGFRSITQNATFRYLGGPNLCWGLELAESKGAYCGFELRHPFLDRPLAEYVLSIPFNRRLPNGKWKYLLRSALEHDLPPQVAQRKKKTIFDCYAERAMNREKPQLLDLLFSADTWAAAKYTVKLETLKRTVDLPYLDLWNIASLELWLRNSDRYRSLKPFSVKDRPTLHAMPPQEYDRLTSAGLQL